MAEHYLTFTEDELQNEIWKTIPGYEGFYEVSDLGRVRSVRKNTNSYVGRILKPKRAGNKGAYLSVALCVNNCVRYRTIHKLVALAFLGPCATGHEVNHIDGIKRNCRLTNLEYLTPRGNTQHAIRTGLRTFDSIRGERNPNAKLTDAKVREIRRMLSEGVGVTAIGRAVGMPYQRIQEIRDGIGWSHITLD